MYIYIYISRYVKSIIYKSGGHTRISPRREYAVGKENGEQKRRLRRLSFFHFFFLSFLKMLVVKTSVPITINYPLGDQQLQFLFIFFFTFFSYPHDIDALPAALRDCQIEPFYGIRSPIHTSSRLY